MKCKNCGTEFNEGIFCPECGTKNEPMTNENTVVENTITMETQNEEENNNNAVKVNKNLKEEKESQSNIEKKDGEHSEKKWGTISVCMGVLSMITLGGWIIPEILGIIFATKAKKDGKMTGMAKIGLALSIIASFGLVTSLFSSSGTGGGEFRTGHYLMDGEKEHPFVDVWEGEVEDASGNISTKKSIWLEASYSFGKKDEDVEGQTDKDGKYYVEGEGWTYIISFGEDDTLTVEIEQQDDADKDFAKKTEKWHKELVGKYHRVGESEQAED